MPYLSFFERWQGDIWSSTCGWHRAGSVAARHKHSIPFANLTTHPLFKLSTPNKVRALPRQRLPWPTRCSSTVRTALATTFVAGKVLDVDKLNPQVAARLLGAFRSYRALEPVRQASWPAAALGEGCCSTGDMSRDIREIVIAHD